MFNNTRVTIFPESHRPELSSITVEFHPEGSIDDFYGAIIGFRERSWTVEAAMGHEPAQLIINTMVKRRTYNVPKLVEIRGRCLLLQGLFTGEEPSGTLRKIESHYILIREYHPT